MSLHICKELWFNSKNGYIDNKLKYMRRKQKVRESINSSVLNVSNIQNISMNAVVPVNDVSSDEMKQLFTEMQSLVVNENNIPLFKDKLSKTIKYRLEISANSDSDLQINFPYFFTHPELVVHAMASNYSICMALAPIFFLIL